MKVKTLVLTFPILLVIVAFTFLSCGDRTAVYSSSPNLPDVTIKRINVFIENSGSMDGYMSPGSELKDAVYSYVSNASRLADTTYLHYINSEIIPYRANLQSFIRDLTPESFHNAGGSRANSDIANMFTKMLRESKAGTISIFVSDCILDVPDGNANLFFNRLQIDLRNTIADYLTRYQDFSVALIQLESTFTGTYYYNKNSEQLVRVKRPYYIIVMGRQCELARLFSRQPLTDIGYGVKHYAAWATNKSLNFMLTNAAGGIPTMKGENNVLSLSDNGDGNFVLKMSLNLRPSLQSDTTITNPRYWSIKGVQNAKINRIVSTSSDTLFTHVLTLTIPQVETGNSIKVTFHSPGMPEWVIQANDDTGQNVRSNLNRTTGIKYIVAGIKEAFEKKTNTFTATFSIQ